jgi:hypothetical protein
MGALILWIAQKAKGGLAAGESVPLTMDQPKTRAAPCQRRRAPLPKSTPTVKSTT